MSYRSRDNSPAAVDPGFDIARLAGRYELTLVQTVNRAQPSVRDIIVERSGALNILPSTRGWLNVAGDSVSRGTLELRPTTIEPLPNWKRGSPLWGWTDLDFTRAGSFATSPTSRDQNRPGIQVRFDEDRRRLSMNVGNGIYSDQPGTINVTRGYYGAFLYAFRADAARIVGR